MACVLCERGLLLTCERVLQHLNAMQSAVFHKAFHTNHNLLILAPTGAGKTMVAVSVLFREILRQREEEEQQKANGGSAKTHRITVYIAPLKALASEVTRNLGGMLGRLTPARRVLEVTGDLDVSLSALRTASVLVCTPEKWDVITRKPSSLSLTELVRVVIIDEVHMLHEERGPVLEALLARSFRQADLFGRSACRMVGLTATLPNELDVAEFLRVDPAQGLFRFSNAWRPVPLRQHVVGVSALAISGAKRGGGAARGEGRDRRRVGWKGTLEDVRTDLQQLTVRGDAGASNHDWSGVGGIAGDEARERDSDAMAPASAGGARAARLVTSAWAPEMKEALLKVCWHKVAQHREQGHQVLVFVHTRRDTRATANDLLARAQREGKLSLLSPRSDEGRQEAYMRSKRALDAAREPELPNLALNGVGVHHAGMLRADRLAVENAFSSGALAVLVCTSTLAWGVNLPARAVVIKGAHYYDPSVGATVPLGPLELLQMFGRAGRPQYDDEGDAYILCAQPQVESLVRQLSSQIAIESRLDECLPHHINAEIAAGTITSEDDSVEWMRNTFLAARMRRNPDVFGLPRLRGSDAGCSEGAGEIADEGSLISHLRSSLGEAIDTLIHAGLVVKLGSQGAVRAGIARAERGGGEQDGEMLVPTSLSRTVSHYYLGIPSALEIASGLRDNCTLHDVLLLGARTSEMSGLAVRDDERAELLQLSLLVPFVPSSTRALTAKVRKGAGVSGGRHSGGGGEDEMAEVGEEEERCNKVSILIQCVSLGVSLTTASLVSDALYVSQNAPRVFRAIAEVALQLGLPATFEKALNWAQAVELQTPLMSHALLCFLLAPDAVTDPAGDKTRGARGRGGARHKGRRLSHVDMAAVQLLERAQDLSGHVSSSASSPGALAAPGLIMRLRALEEERISRKGAGTGGLEGEGAGDGEKEEEEGAAALHLLISAPEDWEDIENVGRRGRGKTGSMGRGTERAGAPTCNQHLQGSEVERRAARKLQDLATRFPLPALGLSCVVLSPGLVQVGLCACGSGVARC